MGSLISETSPPSKGKYVVLWLQWEPLAQKLVKVNSRSYVNVHRQALSKHSERLPDENAMLHRR